MLQDADHMTGLTEEFVSVANPGPVQAGAVDAAGFQATPLLPPRVLAESQWGEALTEVDRGRGPRPPPTAGWPAPLVIGAASPCGAAG